MRIAGNKLSEKDFIITHDEKNIYQIIAINKSTFECISVSKGKTIPVLSLPLDGFYETTTKEKALKEIERCKKHFHYKIFDWNNHLLGNPGIIIADNHKRAGRVLSHKLETIVGVGRFELDKTPLCYISD